MVLVPLLEEVASFTRSAGDGYFLVSLMGEPGTAYPLNLRVSGSYEPDYLEAKFKLDRRGYAYSPEETVRGTRGSGGRPGARGGAGLIHDVRFSIHNPRPQTTTEVDG